MSFVDRMHQAGIGVILDFAPVHFATDSYALGLFDGDGSLSYSQNFSTDVTINYTAYHETEVQDF